MPLHCKIQNDMMQKINGDEVYTNVKVMTWLKYYLDRNNLPRITRWKEYRTNSRLFSTSHAISTILYLQLFWRFLYWRWNMRLLSPWWKSLRSTTQLWRWVETLLWLEFCMKKINILEILVLASKNGNNDTQNVMQLLCWLLVYEV